MNKQIIKQLGFFLKLKWGETLGYAIKHYPYTCITSTVIFFIQCYMFTVNEEGPFILVLFMSASMTMLYVVMITLLRLIWPDFRNWIAANWKKAGEMMKDEK